MERKSFTKYEAKKAAKVLRDMFKYNSELSIYVEEKRSYITFTIEDEGYLTSTTIGTAADFVNAYKTIGYEIFYGCRAKDVGGSIQRFIPVIEINLEIK